MTSQELCDRRLRVLTASQPHRRALVAAWSSSSDGPERWLTSCGWTYDPRNRKPHRQFVPWPVQVRALADLVAAIRDGHDVLIDKSRDMGASWLCLAAFVWYWLFVPSTPLLVASRKEDYVDAAGNPDTLFWKLDYLVGHIPPWLRPRIDRRHMHLANLDNGSVIDGEATNGDLGRGGRRKAILLDEFAAVENGAEILAATADATPCRVFNSTPKGRGNAFADVRFSGKVKVVTLHWKDHPEKGRRAALAPDAAGKMRWTSPWYESETARRTSRKEIAQELDIDYLASGDAFFDLDVLQQLRASGQIRPAMMRGAIRFDCRTHSEGASYQIENVTFEMSPKGRFQWWGGLLNNRPPQDRNYAVFGDISHGSGASNSVLKIADVQTREEIGALADPDIAPGDLARYAVALCRWLGGQRPAVLGWENNGFPEFGLEVYRCGYAHVLGNTDTTRLWTKEDSGEIGWHSSREEKRGLLGQLRAALARGEIILHDEATVAELEQYIDYPSGSVGPSSLVQEAEGGRATHGDRVIGTAGLLLVMAMQARAKDEPVKVPWNSFAGRQAEARRARDRA